MFVDKGARRLAYCPDGPLMFGLASVTACDAVAIAKGIPNDQTPNQFPEASAFTQNQEVVEGRSIAQNSETEIKIYENGQGHYETL